MRMLPIFYESEADVTARNLGTNCMIPNEGNNEKETIPKAFDDEDFEQEPIKTKNAITKKPCAIVVLSNIQNPSMQSLLRKYKYDANGILIPSSVKYFIKLPQSLKSSSVLLPLNDKAFSPLGGFVRYYKEVPPIPHSW
ncbi:uncharacterized protein LOC112048057 [Bicyclus anynana]|uniref:Uncharacterized protein LOC112048057 n=1 Tax=Bicyclus anynana TaxID=110368 RepID=A0ABM3LTI2_BICAN|nr:uncharacterized protein LOC112048057 [Bicyclus anynana]